MFGRFGLIFHVTMLTVGTNNTGAELFCQYGSKIGFTFKFMNE